MGYAQTLPPSIADEEARLNAALAAAYQRFPGEIERLTFELVIDHDDQPMAMVWAELEPALFRGVAANTDDQSLWKRVEPIHDHLRHIVSEALPGRWPFIRITRSGAAPSFATAVPALEIT